MAFKKAALFSLVVTLGVADAQDHYQVEFFKAYSGGDNLNVNAVNSNGVSVGWLQRAQKIYEAAAWSQARTILLVGPDEPELTWANGINDSNMIVGYEEPTDGSGGSTPCLWQARRVCTPLKQPPKSVGSIAIGISNSGTIVGIDYLDEQNGQAVVWKDAGAEPLLLEAAAGQLGSQAVAVNDSGLIVGSSDTHAAAWIHGKLIVLPDLFIDASSNVAVGVDANGEILVSGRDVHGGHSAAVLADHKSYKLPGLPTIPYFRLAAAAMNASGVIVGYGPKTPAAVRWSGVHGQTIVDLNDLIDPAYAQQGWSLQAATAISADGHIAGNAANSNMPGSVFRFLLTPD